MVYKLESYKAGTPEHASLLKSTMDILNRHVREEEQDDLLLLKHTSMKVFLATPKASRGPN